MENMWKIFSTKEYEKKMEEKIKNAKKLALYISKGLKKTKKNEDFDDIKLTTQTIERQLNRLRYYIKSTEEKGVHYIPSTTRVTKKIKKLTEKYGEIDGSIYRITLDDYVEKIEKNDIKYYRKSDFIFHDGNIYDREKHRIINKKIIPVEEIKDKLYIGIDDNGKEIFLKIKDAHKINMPQNDNLNEKCATYIEMIDSTNNENVLNKFTRSKENIKTLKNAECKGLELNVMNNQCRSLIRLFKIGEQEDDNLTIKFKNLFEYITCFKIIKERNKNKRIKHIVFYLKNR